jgi:N-acetyl-gamma-glutamyl-phosphate reductase common form
VTGPIKAVVLGSTGYVGGELLRLIAAHPNFELAAAVSETHAGDPIGSRFPSFAHCYPRHSFHSAGTALDGFGNDESLALFSAAPHGASASAIAGILGEAGARSLDVHVVDSSADFRYKTTAEFEAVYGIPHPAPELLDSFSCAVPEHLTAPTSPHIGHPGCFATASLLAAVPLFACDLAEPAIFLSGVTGSTGSGRSPTPGTHHPERHSNMYAYKPLSHRHAPEIAALIGAASDRQVDVHFVPHSGPFARGIYVTLQATLKSNTSEADVREAFRTYYQASPFAHVVDDIPRLKDVVASNYCHIGVSTRDRQVVVMSAIDNLVKGAAGGAIQWMNRLCSLPQISGLTATAPAWT